MDLSFLLKLSLIFVVFIICYWFREENRRRRD